MTRQQLASLGARPGDRIYSAQHKGEIVVTRVSCAGVVGRKVRKSGVGVEDREVVVYGDDLRVIWPQLI